MGASFMETTKIKERMEEVGFVDVQGYICKIPIGSWPKNKHLKRVGALELVNMVDGIEGLSLRLLSKVLGMRPEDVQILLMEKTLAMKWPIRKIVVPGIIQEVIP
ncbi:hypothetical protein LTR51_004038 [Lithohypha guttulata]|nr:hypothetical protein LTR51_004038 [Lithohypha guttulata]